MNVLDFYKDQGKEIDHGIVISLTLLTNPDTENVRDDVLSIGVEETRVKNKIIYNERSNKV